MKLLIVILKVGIWKTVIGSLNCRYDLIKQAKNTNVCKPNAIILPLFNPEIVINILPRKVDLYHLKQWYIQQGLNRELQNLPFSSISPLTAKYCDRYVLSVATIIDPFICSEACCHVTSKKANFNFHSSTFVTSKLTIDRQTEYRHIR